MQKSERNDLMILLGLLEALGKIRAYAAGLNSAEELYQANSQLNYNAILNLLAQVGERSGRLSDATLQASTNVDWDALRGFRNRVVHDYEGLDTAVVYGIVATHVPQMQRALLQVVRLGLQRGVFDRGELDAATGNSYYRYVDFGAVTA